ncbi:MAG: hypothetical protein ACOVLG_11870 [Flavobacterium sp.]
MKKILVIIVFILGTEFSFADCASSGFQFFPEKRSISLNSMFIIQGYLGSQKTIQSFKNREVYLESENGELILLKLHELLKGQMNLTQAIFKPVSELKPNTKYFLKYSNETEGEILARRQWNSETKQMEKVYWQTSEIKSTNLINQNLKIDYQKTDVIHYGCGPSSNAIFNVTNRNNLEIWYKTEVTEISTNTTTIFYITDFEKKLEVGHDMCSGAFRYKNSGKYKVRFTPMNIDGEALKATEWKVFDSPFANDKTFTK